MKTGATLNRGSSNQSYETPDDFIKAVESRFGSIDFDLAATEKNHLGYNWIGKDDDSLKQDWNSLSGNLWLNPPFSNIAPWAKKCSEYEGSGGILFLVPASVGSNWFRDFVYAKSLVIFLNGRLTFKGCSQPYPKDLILAVFSEHMLGTEVWNWRK